MKNIFLLLLFLFIFTQCDDTDNNKKKDNNKTSENYNIIDHDSESLNKIFTDLEHYGVNMDKPMLYGYFFYDKTKNDLENLNKILLKEGYTLNRLELVEEGEYILHVEKIEIHTRETLNQRNAYLKKLAEENDVDLYDYWDVGPTDQTALFTISSFEEFLNTKNDEEIFQTAIYLYNINDYNFSYFAFDKCLTNNYKADTCTFKMGNCLLEMKPNQEQLAINLWKKGLDINPKYFKLSFNIAATSYYIGDYITAKQYYKKTIQIDSTNDESYYGLASSLYELGETEEALLYCNKTLEINPNNQNAIILKNNFLQNK